LTQQPEQPETHALRTGAQGSLPAGRVGRPHGLDGSFYVTRPQPRLLQIGVTVIVAGRPATIVRRSGTEQRPIVRVGGVEDRSAAEALRGTELVVDGGEAPALSDGEWWAHELEGCEVVDGDELLGTVSRLIELPSCEALEVRPARGGEMLLVPMVKDAVRRVEPAQGRIEVDLGFLGLAGGEAHPRGSGHADADSERGGAGSEPGGSTGA
jgi:16S rRNA processing protein RimM